VKSSEGESENLLNSNNNIVNGGKRSYSGYKTKLGQMILGDASEVLKSDSIRRYRGKIQLIFTSPPFPLNRKKKYGNLQGEEYIDWLAGFAPLFKDLLTPNGSIVIELGNSWESRRPVMSPLNVRSLLSFLDQGKLNLCQQFICYNPARLPSPAQWVNVERIRLKDAFTYVWWFSPVDRPKANNRRVPKAYSSSMRQLLSSKKYNSGRRPSEHNIGINSFLRDNNGAIPPNVLIMANTRSSDLYLDYCRKYGIAPHPARMQLELPKFFIEFLTDPEDIVLDPFAGSNTTGAVAEQLNRHWMSIEIEKKYVTASEAWFF
jgi:DNA modification methylase